MGDADGNEEPTCKCPVNVSRHLEELAVRPLGLAAHRIYLSGKIIRHAKQIWAKVDISLEQSFRIGFKVEHAVRCLLAKCKAAMPGLSRNAYSHYCEAVESLSSHASWAMPQAAIYQPANTSLTWHCMLVQGLFRLVEGKGQPAERGKTMAIDLIRFDPSK